VPRFGPDKCRQQALPRAQRVEEWVPERLECLFIAESPPGNSERFFYNPELKGQLRENLFDLLGVKRGNYDRLLEFEARSAKK
jgi:hypothetical protein